MRNFIAQLPLLMMSTVDAGGFPTVSPKVEDEPRALILERKVNTMALSFANLINGLRPGLLFLVPRVSEVLRMQE